MAGKDLQEHDANLKKLLDRARAIQLKLNPFKCKFQVNEVTYVGHVFTSEGLKVDHTNNAAISEMSVTTDVASLQRFLGMMNYLRSSPRTSASSRLCCDI